MNVRQCRRCDKLFQYQGNPNCPNCVRALDDIFVKVRDILYSTPHIEIEELCEQTGATRENIVAWLREGRLLADPKGPKLLNCESCGQPIHTGRFCGTCAQTVSNQLRDSAQMLSPKEPKDFTGQQKAKRGFDLHVNLNRDKR